VQKTALGALENEKKFSTSTPVRRLDVRMENHGRSLGRIDGWWSELLHCRWFSVMLGALGPQPNSGRHAVSQTLHRTTLSLTMPSSL